MTFAPALPATGQIVTIEVRSTRGYLDVALTGPDDPAWTGVTRDGIYYVWRWTITYATAGSRTYNFTINNGALTCKTGTVTVLAPTFTSTPTATATHTSTPTPTATDQPLYGVSLSGEGSLPVAPGGTAVFNVSLTNTGDAEDTFDVGLNADPPGGWQAKYCIGGACYDYSVPSQSVTVPAGGSQGLSIKLIAPGDAPAGQSVGVVLWARSQHDANAYAEHPAVASVQGAR
jgi:hypothetical protein